MDHNDYEALKVLIFKQDGYTSHEMLSADLNGDGTVDAFDLYELDKLINGVSKFLMYDVGDANGDNKITQEDYDYLKSVIEGKQIFKNGAEYRAADINGDGIVDSLDLYELDKLIYLQSL